MDIGIFGFVEARDSVDHGLRLLRGGGVVQPDERLAVDALAQDREIAARGIDVEKAGRQFQIGERVRAEVVILVRIEAIAS